MIGRCRTADMFAGDYLVDEKMGASEAGLSTIVGLGSVHLLSELDRT